MAKYGSYSVRQIKKKKSLVWQARLLYKDVNGKWKETSKVLPEAKGKREAQKLAEQWFDEMNAQAEKDLEGEKYKTVSEVVMAYLDWQLSIGKLESSTYNQQVQNFHRNIEPYLGNNSFNDLDRTAIMAWHTALSKKGCSQRYIYSNYIIIAKVYNYYVSIGEIARNPFNLVKISKDYGPKVTHLTPDQMKNYVAAAYLEYDIGDPMLLAVLLPFYAGLRREECCGLRWRDIDLINGYMSITSAIGLGTEGAYTKMPKNKSSARTFPLLPQLKDLFQQTYDKIKPEGSWFVIGDEEHFMSPRTYSHKYKAWVDAYNLVDAYGKPLTSHMLRHSFATTGVRSGMDIASLSKVMGHASRAMTLDTYADATKDAMITASRKLASTFKRESDLDE